MKPPTRQDIVEKYLNKDEVRFLKRFYQAQKNELFFSKVIPQYSKPFRKLIFSKLGHELPVTLGRIILIHKIMVKYYGFYEDEEDLLICKRIEYCMTDIIDDYVTKRDRRRFGGGFKHYRYHTAVKARQELKARGFIKPSKFKNFKKGPGYAHIMSNGMDGKSPLIYPMNMQIGRIEGLNYWELPNGYIAHALVGVTGFTKVQTYINNTPVKTKKKSRKKK